MYDIRTWFQHGTVLLSLLLTIPTTTHAQNSNSNSNSNIVSIFSESELENLRPCASTCMDGTSIAEWLRCRAPLMNECFCRRGLTSIGRASLFDCAKAGCNGDYEIDGMALTSVYTSYCNVYLARLQTTTSSGSPASNSARTTSTGEENRTTLQTSRQTTTGTIPTETSASSDSGGLNTGAVVGVVIGALAFVGICAGGGIWWYKRGRRRSEDPFPGIPSGGSANEAFIGAYPKSEAISAISSVEIGGTPLRELEVPQTPGELEGSGTPPLAPGTSRSIH